MRGKWSALWRALTGLLLDPACVGCGGTLPGSSGPACPACLQSLERAARPCCLTCSLPLAGATPAGPCGACSRRPASPPVAAPRAHEGVTRRLVLALKAGRRPEIAETLARATARDERVASFLKAADLLVPVPAHPLRCRERGYDQAELLARELRRQARRLGRRPAVARLLSRRDGLPAQGGSSRAARLRTPGRSLRAGFLTARRVAGRRVVLVDDVVTTGASLRAASRLLRRLGAADVCAIAITRTGTIR